MKLWRHHSSSPPWLWIACTLCRWNKCQYKISLIDLSYLERPLEASCLTLSPVCTKAAQAPQWEELSQAQVSYSCPFVLTLTVLILRSLMILWRHSLRFLKLLCVKGVLSLYALLPPLLLFRPSHHEFLLTHTQKKNHIFPTSHKTNRQPDATLGLRAQILEAGRRVGWQLEIRIWMVFHNTKRLSPC